MGYLREDVPLLHDRAHQLHLQPMQIANRQWPRVSRRAPGYLANANVHQHNPEIYWHSTGRITVHYNSQSVILVGKEETDSRDSLQGLHIRIWCREQSAHQVTGPYAINKRFHRGPWVILIRFLVHNCSNIEHVPCDCTHGNCYGYCQDKICRSSQTRPIARFDFVDRWYPRRGRRWRLCSWEGCSPQYEPLEATSPNLSPIGGWVDTFWSLTVTDTPSKCQRKLHESWLNVSFREETIFSPVM